MNRAQKTQEVELLKQKISDSQVVILVDYKGVAVNDFNDLRKKLREKDAEIKVIKNRLAKLAVRDSDNDILSDHFSGTIAMATSVTDPTSPAKVLVDFEKMDIKAGAIGGKIISVDEIKALASMPSKEELIAKLLGSMQAPMNNLVSAMAQIPRQLVNVLSAVRDQK